MSLQLIYDALLSYDVRSVILKNAYFITDVFQGIASKTCLFMKKFPTHCKKQI